MSQLLWNSCAEYREKAHLILADVANKIDTDNLIPKETLDLLINEGFYSLNAGALDDLICRVRALSYYSPGVAHSLLVSASAWLATEMQEYSGIFALSVTEPRGGTDIRSSLETTAVEEENRILIRGRKIFTSNAPYADYFIVLALSSSGPTLYIVPRSEAVKYEILNITGLRGTGASIVYYNDAEAIASGTPGRGLKEALQGINLGRLGYGAIALGIADAALSLVVSTGSSKIIFDRPLIDYQGIKWRIASIYSKITMLESLIADVVSNAGESWVINPTKAAIVKNEGAKLAQDAAWLAVQILGGRGLEVGNKAERMQRDARALDIGEGAREVLYDFIASKAIKFYKS